MGENHAAAGFADADAMVAAFVASEDAEVLGMAEFIAAGGMAAPLRDQDWAGFARLYNGSDYAAHNYDGHVQYFHDKYSTGTRPALMTRAAQVYLTYRGFAVGGIDGVLGPGTTAAVRDYQTRAGVPVTGVIDAALIQRLAS